MKSTAGILTRGYRGSEARHVAQDERRSVISKLSFVLGRFAVAMSVLMFAEPAPTLAQLDSPVKVYEHESNQWFEGPATWMTISADGRQAIVYSFTGTRVIDLPGGEEDRAAQAGGRMQRAVFCGSHVARFDGEGSQPGWHVVGSQFLDLSLVPARAVPMCSSDESTVAYWFRGQPDAGVTILGGAKPQHYVIGGRITTVIFAPDKKALFVLSRAANGRSALIEIDPPAIDTKILASNLDAAGSNTLAVTPNGRALFLALVSDAAPDDFARHKPDAPRWLKVYRFDIASRTLHLVVSSGDQDNFAPAVADGELYWVRNLFHNAVAFISAAGGEAREIANGQLPIWSFDGRRISYYVGGERLADWALNLDAAVIRLDRQGKVTASPEIIVSGFHEDYPAAFSPNGKFIAFHSHRSPTPVTEYDAPGSADDIFLRRADDRRAPELRLTDFGGRQGRLSGRPTDGS